MFEKFQWGVLGNATIARVCVIPAMHASRNGIVRALASRRPQAADELVKQNRIKQVYDDYQALIDDPNIEGVYIPLPNHMHHEWTIKALSAGKHVLCEKPLACNAAQAQEMADVAASNQRLLMEGFMYRFHPRSRKIKELLESDAIGAPRLIRSAFCYRMSAEDAASPDNARLQPEMGGGALLDVGCYSVSVARWLYDAEPGQVQCQACYHPGGVDLHAAGTLKFENDRLATFEVSFVAGLQQTYTVVGENGVIDLPQDAFIPWDKDASYTLRQGDADAAEPAIVPGADEYRLMVEHFADSATGIAELDYPILDSVCNMRVLDALAAAARTG